jgi:hypothetical protein
MLHQPTEFFRLQDGRGRLGVGPGGCPDRLAADDGARAVFGRGGIVD